MRWKLSVKLALGIAVIMTAAMGSSLLLLTIKRYQHPLSVVMIDMDHFKNYNDTHDAKHAGRNRVQEA